MKPLLLSLATLVAAGCTESKTETQASQASQAPQASERESPGARVEAPGAPPMPADWKLVKDETFSPTDIEPVAAKLGAKISALRNTTYDVGGYTVKLNTIVTPSSRDLDTIYSALVRMKPKEFVVRRKELIYEFVGPNEAVDAIARARKTLGGESP